jgi:ABC-2 type transport system permease protein
METSRYPGDIFRGVGKIIFTFIIPIGIIATVPASILTGRIGLGFAVTALFVGSLFLSIGLWVWRRSIEHYSSASG